jgi:predicted component of type VI protein secretion system
MEVQLKVLVGSSAGQTIKVPGPKFYIGRSEDCQLRPRSDLISRHHCAIIVEGEYVAVRDFGSKNGTYVNDERVSSERELKPGDRVKVGPLEFEVCYDLGSLGGPKRPKVGSIKEAAARTADSGVVKKPGQNPDEIDLAEWLGEDLVAESDTREMRAPAAAAASSPPRPRSQARSPARRRKTPTPAATRRQRKCCGSCGVSDKRRPR